MIQVASALAKEIMFYASKLRATRAYWWQRGGELVDMVKQEGSLHVFFTLSATDMYWPDLFKASDPNLNLDKLPEAPRQKLAENSKMASKFFSQRAGYHVKHVIVKQFRVKNYWFS